MTSRFFLLAALLSGLLACTAAGAGEVRVAVAAGIAEPIRQIAASFEKDTGNKVLPTVGATSGLYRQIVNGAVFDVLLPGNSAVLAKLEAENWLVPGSRYTYAMSQLVLWSPREGYVDNKGDVLLKNQFQRLSVASPSLVYGRPAVQVLAKLGMTDAVAQKLVERETMAQSRQLVAAGGADLGILTLPQVYANGKLARGSAWVIPQSLYDPIEQEAAILDPGRDNPVARSFIFYLKGPKAAAILLAYGYYR